MNSFFYESLKRYLKEKHIENQMQLTRQGLINDIEARKYKISVLDKIAFSIELDCRRKEEQVRELAGKKDRIEKLNANILNNDNEGYSKLKHIIKENVKAVLSEK